MDSETGRELYSYSSAGYAVAFSPNSRVILTNMLRASIERNDFGASCAILLDAATGRAIGTIGYGPLNVGARAYADLQISRFLGDTAAAGRHEAVLQFIVARGYATRSEIEAFYRNGIRGLVSEVVDEEFRGVTVPAQTAAYVKESVTNFLLTPNQANFNVLRSINNIFNDNIGRNLPYIQSTYDFSLRNIAAYESNDMPQAAEAARSSARTSQNILNERRRQLRAPNDAPIDWDGFASRYLRILNGLNTDLARRVTQ